MGKKQEEQWKQRLKELKAYKQKHGDCLVPQNYKHNRKLGNWVDTQRVQYKKRLNGVNSWITQERIDQLNEIDFEWEVGRTKKPDDTLWKQRFNELVKYKKSMVIVLFHKITNTMRSLDFGLALREGNTRNG